MANKESTAVNELIDLMQGSKPVQGGSDDLLFSAPKPSTKVTPPRMTATVPSLRGGGEVAPLPMTRAPSGTSQLNVRRPVIRVTTAPPSRHTTIPPLPSRAADLPEAAPAPQPLQKAGATLPPPRPSRPSLPAPARTQPPASSPVAAPFAASSSAGQPVAAQSKELHPFAAAPVVTGRPRIDAPGDIVYADHWFEASRGMDLVDDLHLGTQPVKKKVKNIDLVKKLVAPMAGLVLIGVCVGGFLAFNGEGGRRPHKPKAPVVAAATAPTEGRTDSRTDVTAALPPKYGGAAVAAQGAADPGAEPQPEVVAKVSATAEPAKAAEVPAAAEPAKAAVAPAPDVKAAATAAAPNPEGPKAESVTEPIKAAPPAKAVAMATTTPTVREVQTTRGTVKLVDVRIDSKPAGATVVLVDNGKTSFLGTTPISASVDPARAYDVILTLEGRPTQMSHFDPAKTQRLEIDLAKAVPQAAVAKAVPQAAVKAAAQPAKVETPAAPPAKHHHHDVKPAAGLAAPTFGTAEKKAEPKVEKKVAVAEAKGSGVLMISSKPPCKIFVDGKDTGLSTPQRSLALLAGPHKITLVNAQENVNKTMAVQITADQSTKLIQDLMTK